MSTRCTGLISSDGRSHAEDTCRAASLHSRRKAAVPSRLEIAASRAVAASCREQYREKVCSIVPIRSWNTAATPASALAARSSAAHMSPASAAQRSSPANTT